MGAQLHETAMGQRFYQVTLPRIADELVALNNNLAALVILLRERTPAAPQPPAARMTEPHQRG